jgi:hypothetical protein
MNASNMKLTYGKLYTVQDTLNMKTKLYRKHEEELTRYKKKINTCEQDTIIFVNNILISKQNKEKELIKKYTYTNYSYIWIFILVLILGFKELCV